MKKIFILLGILFMSYNSANSLTVAQNFCPVEENVGNSFTKVLSNITGANFIATKMIELTVQKEIKKALGARVNVEIYPYTFGALTKGKMKKMTIESKSLNLDGLIISDFYAETLCNYIHIEKRGNDILFKENSGLNFSFKITNDDLAETIKTTQFLNKLNSMKIVFMGQTILRVNSVKLGMENNKLVIVAKVLSPIVWGVEPKTITATADMKYENGKISYTNIGIQNVNLENNGQALTTLLNMINPFIFEINITKNSHGYTTIKNVKIENNEMNVEGMIYIPKNN